MTVEHDAQAALRLTALRAASEEANRRCGDHPLRSSERLWFLGVAMAADHAAHPERIDARPRHWLEGEEVALREGYLAMESRLGALVGGADFPGRIRLPEPEVRPWAIRP